MADLRLLFDPGADQWGRAMQRHLSRISNAAGKGMDAAVGVVKTQGRGAIGAAGFSTKWQNALRVKVYGDKRRIDSAAYVYHSIPYAGVFQTGATIKGSPLLWLPLSTAPRKAGGRRITAGNYEQIIGGKLHTIKRPGKPPLLAAYVAGAPKNGRAASVAQLRRGAVRARRGQANAAFGGRAGRYATISLPLFVGIRQATIRRRFDLRGIYQKAQLTLVGTYLRELSNG